MMNNYKPNFNLRNWAKGAIFCMAMVMVFGSSLKAQLAMTRSTFTGAFSPITTGGGATAYAGAVGDDAVATAIPIGFSFNYLGTAYTTFTACSNGWISFTATSSSAGNVNLYSTSAPNATLAPWWDDLSSSEVLAQTTGTPGSQVCTIQWTSLSYFTTSTRTIKYQVKLYEGTNVIEFCYDAAPTGTVYTSESASIGIESATGGNGQYLDAVTGSSFTGNGTLQSDRWPSYNFRFTPGAPTPLAGGTYNVGVGQTYQNLNEAVADINHRGISGAITLNLVDAQYDITTANGGNFFPILLGPVAGSGAANTCTITKSGTPAIISYGGASGTNGFIVNQASTSALSSNVDPIIGLFGADYVTIENLDIRGNVNNQVSDHGIGIYNSSATDGATNNIVQNVSVTMSRANTGSRGFMQNVVTTPTAVGGANSTNTFRNFTITNVYGGIQLTGNATYPDLNTVIGNTVCTNFNTIGNPSQANDIGNGTSSTYGIRATNQSGISVYNNSIRNVTGSAVQTDGIFIETFQGTSSVYNNKIQTVKNSSTSSTTAIAGIRASHSTTGSHTLRIYNNVVSEIVSAYTGTASANRTLKGIFISGTGGSSTYEVHNNSVSMDGSSSLGLSSVAFEIASASAPVFHLSNNIFANFTAAQIGVAKHYGLMSTSATAFGATGSSSTNNDIYIANDAGTSGHAVLGNTTNYNTVADWTTASTYEAASLSVNPSFVSNTSNLHSTNLALNGTGLAYQAFITTDLDCAARTPDNDIGAYILSGCSGTPTAGAITGASSVCSGLGTTLTLNGASTDAGVTYQWAASTTAGGPYTNMGTSGTQATGALTATTYYVVTVLCGPSGLSSVTPEYTVSVNPLPNVTVNPTSALYCVPGTAIAVSASGASTYTWSPSAGLSATSGAGVNASPSATTTYTVTGTDANGCVKTATATITVGNKPTIVSTTATPPAVCSGASSQLAVTTSAPVTQYSFSASSGTYTAITGTSVAGAIGDDAGVGNLPIGFNFVYHGTTYSVFGVSSNGHVDLGQTTATYGGLFTNNLTTNADFLAPLWDDNNSTGGSISYETVGTAPNRVLTVQWANIHVGGSGSSSNPTISMQVKLYEADNHIEFVYGGTSAALTSTSASIGISGVVGNYLSVTPQTPVTSSTVSSSAENNSISSATNFPSGTVYSFAPPTPTFAWTPAAFLNNTTISNPLASGITASTNYTVTVTSASGCASTGTVSITAGAALTSSANITANDTVCAGSNVTLHAVPTGGGAPYTYSWAGPGGFTSMAQDTAINNVTLAQTGTYTVTVTDACGANSVATVSLTVNANPVVTATPDSSVICLPGGSAIALSVTGASTYAWAPATGLSAATGANVNGTPASTTSYTVTGTDANGCIGRDTVVIQVSDNPSITAISAAPNSVCVGGSSQLNVAAGSTLNYSVTAIPYAPIATPGSGVTTLCNGGTATTALSAGSLDDGSWNNRSLPFNFTFYGITYNSFAVSTNGFVVLGSGAPNTYTGYYTNFPDPGCGRPAIGPMYADLDLRTTGKIEYFVTGTAPNRAMVINFIGQFYSGSGSLNTQMIVYESSNVIEVHTTSSTGDNEAVEGIQNAAGTQAVTVPGRNNTLWTVSTPDAYRFTPSAGTFTYAWTPSANLNDATLANPLASGLMSNTTFSVTVTSDLGCISNTTVDVAVNPLSAVNITAVGATTICAGGSVELTATPVGGGPYTYSWAPGTATTPGYTVTPSTSTVYTVTVNNSCGETVSNTVSVTVNALPTVTAAAGSSLYCTPGSPAIVLTVTGANSYVWSPAAGLDVNNASVVNATPAVSTTYTVVGTDVNGCVDTTTVSITAAPAIQGLVATATPATVCANDTVSLSSTATTAYTVFADDFNGATSNWIGVNSSVGGTPAVAAWARQTSPYTASWGTTLNSNDNMFYFTNSDAQGSGSTTNVTLTSPRIDVSGAATLTLNFKHYYRYTATTSENASVSVSTDNMNWTVVQTYTATTGAPTAFAAAALNLDAYAGNDSLYIRYSYKSNWGYGWAIDNVNLTGTLATLNYAWTSAPAGFTSSIAAPSATPAVSTDYMLNVSNAFGCSSADTVSVSVNALPVVTLGNDTAVCSAGLPLTLDAGNTGSTYAWNTTETTQSISALTAGSYDVAVTDANGCVGRDTIAISIYATPVVALGTDTVRCGGSVTLDAGNAGATYQWNDMTTAQTLVVSSSGQYDVVVTSTQGCEGYDTINVTINAVPSVNLGNDTLFCGSSLTIDAGNPGATYFWNTTAATQTINVTSSGQYFVNVTNAQNCSAVDTINVTVAPAITVNLGNDSAICQNVSLFLDAQNVGSTYLWNDNTTNSTITVTNPGTYYVTVTSADGCIAKDTIVFADNSPLVTLSLPFTTTCVNTSVNTLSGGTPSGGFYSGTGVTGTNFNATTVGSFVISYTYTDATTGCAATDTQAVVVDPCIGVKEVNVFASIVVAPNPNTGNFSIMMPSRELIAKAEMYTLDGKLIYSEKLKGKEVYDVNITNLANAIYYLRLTVDGETNVIKVVKQD